MDWYVRPPELVAIARRASYLFVIPGRSEPVLIEPLDVEAMARVLGRTVQPISHADLCAECDESTIALLVDLGVLVASSEPAPRDDARPRPSKPCKTIVVGLAGAVGVASVLPNVIALADHFADNVEVVVSDGARKFIQPQLYSYYGLRVWTDPFQPAHGIPVPHSYLATAADLVLVAPASASMLHKLASGACSDLISLVVAATKAPVVVAPSTNPQMWMHPPVQRNAAQLRADGIWVVEPGLGIKIAQRDQAGVGAGSFEIGNLMRALASILEPKSAK